MVLEADDLGCVREVLVIASALSIQDPRERPQEKIEQANESPQPFQGGRALICSRSCRTVGLPAVLKQRELSGNQFRRMCRKEFLNYSARSRVDRPVQPAPARRRRAQDSGPTGPRKGLTETHPDHVHPRTARRPPLAGRCMRERETRDYRGARDARFVIARGSVIGRKQPDWVMAAELVETNRLYARQRRRDRA